MKVKYFYPGDLLVRQNRPNSIAGTPLNTFLCVSISKSAFDEVYEIWMLDSASCQLEKFEWRDHYVDLLNWSVTPSPSLLGTSSQTTLQRSQ